MKKKLGRRKIKIRARGMRRKRTEKTYEVWGV